MNAAFGTSFAVQLVVKCQDTSPALTNISEALFCCVVNPATAGASCDPSERQVQERVGSRTRKRRCVSTLREKPDLIENELTAKQRVASIPSR